MTDIRLAYDITVLGTYFSWPDSKTGIFRVTEEILNNLVQMPSIKTDLVSLCGEEIVFTSVGCEEYLKSRQSQERPCFSHFQNVHFQATYQSRLSLEWLYSIFFRQYFSENFHQRSKFSLEALLVRGSSKILDKSKFFKFDIYRHFNPKSFDVFHSPYYKLPSREVTKDLPRLITIYDLIPITAKQFVNASLNSYFFRLLNSIDCEHDWVACISEHTKQEFCSYTGFPEERAFVTYLAADSLFSPLEDKSKINQVRARYGIPDGEYFLCLASHLDPRKNIFHLIKSFVRLISENPHMDVNLVLIGTLRFEREDVAKALSEFSNYRDRIIFTGYVPDEDLTPIYNGSVAFVFPSLYEGFGLPILEAMQSGTPVISSNSTSMPEVAGDAAILVDSTSEDQLCAAMLDILQDQTLRSDLIARGLKQARAFSWERCTQETVEIYKKMMSSV
jgi:glycosyltransferase involved in cell wall biosynthesis